MEPSSAALHPKSGGRFVFERESADPPSYRVWAHLAGGTTVEGSLAWDADGRAELNLEGAPTWALEAARKLARVLHRDPKEKMVRWRDA